jgi:hypothetical protein
MSRTVSQTFYTQDGVALGNSWSGVQTNLAKIKQEAGYPKSKEDGNSTVIGYVVGQDNLTGKTIASDGNGSLIKGDLSQSPKVLHRVIVNRNKSKDGSRRVSMTGSRKVTFQTVASLVTQGAVGQSEIDICRSASSSGGGAPNPPEDPPEPDPPPPEPPSGPNQPTPNPEEDESQPPGEGCEPESDCQWYNASESGATEGSGCPPGTTSRGFAQLPDGSYKVLCCGPDRPAGDGCPEDPTTYGYQCVNGTCELVPNGLFASASECESGCNQDEPPGPAMRYTCAGIQCIADPNGEYGSLEACQDGCKDGTQTWNPPAAGVGPCEPELGTGGAFANQGDCDETTGQCPNRTYRIDMALSWTAFNPATGEVEPFSFYGGPNFSTPVGIADKLEGPLSGAQLFFYKNTFWPFQEKAGFDIVISGSNGFYRWSRGAPFTGNGGYIVDGPTFSATIIPNNPSIPCN